MTLQTDLEQAVARTNTDSARLKAIVNGPASGAGSTVAVDSGPVKTVARAIQEIGDTSNQAIRDLSNVAAADLAASLRAAGEGTGFRAGANQPADLTVVVAPGIVPRPDQLPLAVPAQAVGPLAAPFAEPRNDLVHVDRLTGVAGIVAGAEAAVPADPALPAGARPIARVRLLPGMAAITDGDLDDLRDGLIGHGSTIARNAGTGPDQLVPLDGAGKLPAVDGSQLGGVLKPGLREYMIPAALLQPAVNQGCGPVESLALGAGKPDLVFRAFDPVVSESGFMFLPLPKSWDGGPVSFQVTWSHGVTATTFGVVWSLDGVAIGDDEPADILLGAAVEIADAGGVANRIYTTDWSAPLAVAGPPADGDVVCFRLTRDVTAVANTLAVDARLVAVRLRITLSGGNDA
jgi:hypothetical protein